MKILFSFKNKFKETARQFISPPQEGFLEALIFGDEENISRRVERQTKSDRHPAHYRGFRNEHYHYQFFDFKFSFTAWFLAAAGVLFYDFFTDSLYFNDWRSGFGCSGRRDGRHFALGSAFRQNVSGAKSRGFRRHFYVIFKPFAFKIGRWFSTFFFGDFGNDLFPAIFFRAF